MAQVKSTTSKSKDESKTFQEEIQIQVTKISTMEKTITTMKSECVELKMKADASAKRLAEVEAQLKRSIERETRLRQEIEALSAKYQALENKYQTVLREKNEIERAHKTLLTKFRELETKFNKMTTELKESKEIVRTLTALVAE